MTETPKILVTADLHLTERGEDEYRWAIFDWIEKRLLQSDEGYTHWAILGDVTEVKDRHPASLIHRVTQQIERLAKICPGVILKGNHDYIDPKEPFFAFLGKLPGVTYVSEPTALQLGNLTVAAIPHLQAWNGANKRKCKEAGRDADFVWCHQCFKGAKNESGGKLGGFSISRFWRCFPKAKGLLAGDIHTPQPIGDVGQYVGGAYPIDFGDNYSPRCVRMEGTDVVSMPRITIKKASLFVPYSEKPSKALADFSKGDRIKVTLDVSRSEMYRWDEVASSYRSYCTKNGIELVSVQPRITGNKKDDVKTHEAMSLTNPVRILAAYINTRKEIDPKSLRYGYKLLGIARKKKK